MSLQSSVTLLRLRGIPIRAHWTLFVVIPYLAFVLAPEFREVSMLPPLGWGAILAVGLFASVTVHELAHAFAAQRFGGRVQAITLMVIGGVSQIAHLPRAPRQETIVAGAGPLCSLVLGGLLLLLHAGSASWAPDIRLALYLLGVMNLSLGLFNLLPAFPMDGGRIVHAGLAARLGAHRATEIAVVLGKGCAIALGFVGVWTSNLMLLLIALFVWTGAHEEEASQTMREAFEGLRVADLLPRRPPPTIDDDQLLAGILARMHELDRLELVVIGRDGNALGVIRAADLRRVDPDHRWSTTAGDLARRIAPCHVAVPARASANDAIELAAEARAEFVLVLDPEAPPAEAIRGLVATDDITRTVMLRVLGASQRGRAGARPVHGSAA